MWKQRCIKMARSRTTKYAGRLILLVLLAFVSCKTNDPQAFTTWRCVENSAILGSRTYLVDVYKSVKDTSVYLISNFHKVSTEGIYDVKVKRTKNVFSIEPQQIGDSQYILKLGSGIINNNSTEMQFNYIIYDGQRDVNVFAVYSR